ncbi:MAG: tetratricopeptide repeat protein [Dehalococcoidia bacterium]|nr:tetratricopeptide repeat protein [Dehalococcoidia bacterium]MDP6226804.1 tetratricopeptide repeat protein [Dehalococcoidia bacterium]MDP7084932.1 tetratricopeptide repeat protein [Dehalococcoidia bacterium]MDP7200012.1 tetratricopeptide repeat protein [Dehalococcoidia bacterium]MDP7511036.1 tetratricopeptide repeat protein [Dehalococcoidia bacterium]
MVSFLLYLSLALVVLWTARVARSKGRSPWVWAGAACLLLLVSNLDLLAIPDLLGIVPMVILMLHKNPMSRARPAPRTCPKCEDPQTRSPKFCTNCGWELATPYPEVSVAEAEKPVSPAVFAESASLEVPDPAAPTPSIEAQPAAAPISTDQEALPPDEPAVKAPVPYGVPTANSLTERGVRLFNQGRTQESIDQFTKAIALDPNYTQAWARRAEAYARLGRGKEAAEDRRQLDALDARSSTG